MTPEERRAMLKREQLREALDAESSDEFRPADEPQKPAGTPEPMFDFAGVDPGAVGAGLVQGAAFDFADEIGAGFQTAGDVVTGRGPLVNAPDYYRSNRDRLRGYFDAKRQKSPMSYLTGEIIGAVAPTNRAFGMVGAGRRAKAGVKALELSDASSKAMTVVDATALAKRAEAAERKAAGLGSFGRSARDSAVQGYGASDSETISGDLANAAVGGVVGGVVGKVTGAIDPKAVRGRANEKALSASGAMTKDFRNLARKGFANDTGQWINQNVIDSPFMSLESIRDKASGHRDAAGGVIGNIIDGADKLREKAKVVIREKVLSQPGIAARGQTDRIQAQIDQAVDREYGFSMNNVAEKIEGMLGRDRGNAAARMHANRLQSLAGMFREIGSEGHNSLRNGLENKTQFRRLMKDVDNLAEEYKQEVYDTISEELERAVGKFDQLSETMAKYTEDPIAETVKKATGSNRLALPVGDAVDIPIAQTTKKLGDEGRDTAKNFRDANREYARAATTEKMAENRIGNVKSNRDFGLTTAIAASTGFMSGGPTGAAAMGAVNNLGRKYGSSSQAFVFHRLANVLEKSPESFGKYAPILRTALARGASSFVVAHNILISKDPQYRQFSEQLLNEDQP